MKKKQKLPSKQSLGGLRRVQRTSDNAPDYLGTMHMLKSTLLVLLKQLNETGADEVKTPKTAAVPKKTATLHAFF